MRFDHQKPFTHSFQETLEFFSAQVPINNETDGLEFIGAIEDIFILSDPMSNKTILPNTNFKQDTPIFIDPMNTLKHLLICDKKNLNDPSRAKRKNSFEPLAFDCLFSLFNKWHLDQIFIEFQQAPNEQLIIFDQRANKKKRPYLTFRCKRFNDLNVSFCFFVDIRYAKLLELLKTDKETNALYELLISHGSYLYSKDEIKTISANPINFYLENENKFCLPPIQTMKDTNNKNFFFILEDNKNFFDSLIEGRKTKWL